MAYTFKDLQDEVKRRAVRNQAGTAYDTAVKNIINTSLFRIAREAPWRQLRRKSSFNTVDSYLTGSGAASATSESTTVTITGATLIADDVHIGRMIELSGSSTVFRIASITGATTLTLDRKWDASTTTNMTYEIYPQEEYTLPVQAGHRMFLWHEDYGYPYKLEYVTEHSFVDDGYDPWDKGTPLRYRMWGEDMTLQQPKQAGRLSVFSSDSGDTSIDVQVFGTVSGYPAYEVITTNASNGATAVTGGLLFSSVERVMKSATSSGRIGVYADANTATVVSVIPMGDTTAGVLYKKVKLHPLPDSRAFPIYVQYYKDPYRLVNDNDIHELGQEFDEVIILLSVAKIKAEDGQKEAVSFYQMYADELRTLRRLNADKIDWFPKLQRPSTNSRDQLVRPNLLYRQAGSNFGPSTRW